MNIFSVLDTSDGEEEVQKVNKKASPSAEKDSKSKPESKSSNKAPAAAPTQNKPRENKSAPVESKSAANPDGDVKGKEDNRGGRPRGKEGYKRGEKQHGNATSENEKPRRPKREFERRSGTGRGKEVSRGGRGPYGFGNVEQEAHDAEKDPAKADAEPQTETADDAGEPEPESTEIVPEVEEPPTLSFDDFIRQREEARANSSILLAPKQVRQVNVETQFAGLTTRTAEEIEDETKQASNGAAKRDQRSTNRTQLLDVQFKFETPNYQRSGGRGRGDRDFNRGGRHNDGGRGRTRKPRDAPAALNSGDFPSL